MLRVSALITTHNRISLLKKAVASVVNQTYDNIEIIVVDDHSTDGTVEWCIDNNINVIENESFGGNAARNLGIRVATGDFVAFLDDDDYWEPNKIELQVRLAEATKADVIYCGIRKEIRNDGELRYEQSFPEQRNTGNVSKVILQDIFTVTSALLVKRSLLFEVGAFDENLKFWQEYELCIRLAQKTDFQAVDKILVGYLVDNGDKNRLTNKYEAWKKAVGYVHKKHKGLYSGLSIIERIKAKRVVLWDAISRSRNAGLKCQFVINTLKLRLSFILENTLKKICS